MLSKVFELCHSQRFELLFKVDKHLFGFVSEMVCLKAIFSLEILSNYFKKRSSLIFKAALDAST